MGRKEGYLTSAPLRLGSAGDALILGDPGQQERVLTEMGG